MTQAWWSAWRQRKKSEKGWREIRKIKAKPTEALTDSTCQSPNKSLIEQFNVKSRPLQEPLGTRWQSSCPRLLMRECPGRPLFRWWALALCQLRTEHSPAVSSPAEWKPTSTSFAEEACPHPALRSTEDNSIPSSLWGLFWFLLFFFSELTTSSTSSTVPCPPDDGCKTYTPAFRFVLASTFTFLSQAVRPTWGCCGTHCSDAGECLDPHARRQLLDGWLTCQGGLSISLFTNSPIGCPRSTHETPPKWKIKNPRWALNLF